jgi:DNA-binding CsgD family transcriptional regulator
MSLSRPIPEVLAELRASVPARRRRGAIVSDAAALLSSLVAGCRTVSVEEKPGGIAFRFEGDEGDNVRITCVLHHSTPAPLTAAEAAVAERLCEGRTLAQIAQARGVSINTIKSQVRQIFRKLNVDSRVALARKLAP